MRTRTFKEIRDDLDVDRAIARTRQLAKVEGIVVRFAVLERLLKECLAPGGCKHGEKTIIKAAIRHFRESLRHAAEEPDENGEEH